MNNSFIRSRTKRIGLPNLSLNWKEANYLKNWIRFKGIRYLNKYEKCSEVLLYEYEKHINEVNKGLGILFTSEVKLSFIKQLLEWHLHLQPEFKRFLRVIGMTNAEFGELLGDKSSSLYNSYARVRVIKGYLAVFQKYNESTCFSYHRKINSMKY
jgi:hypothetical protein